MKLIDFLSDAADISQGVSIDEFLNKFITLHKGVIGNQYFLIKEDHSTAM